MEAGNNRTGAAPNRRRRLVRVAVLVVLLTAAGLVAYRWATARCAAAPSSLALRASPISIRPHPQRCLNIPEEDFRNIRDQVQPFDEGVSTSLYLHALRVFGLDSKYNRGKLASSRDTLRLFAEEEFSKKILGMPLLVRTRYGVRSTPEPLGGAKESHRDYCLAVLSEQGLPASFSMIAGGRSFTFKDFLADSIANFHLTQEEIEWTALAYAMWLPPERKWVNKFGEAFTFDQLATELIQRPFDEAVCAGSHLVHAMIVLSRVDHEECCILSPDVRGKLLNRLAAVVREAEATQAVDGSWGGDWYERLLSDRTPEPESRDQSKNNRLLKNRLLATSHIAEWLMLLPEELRVSDDRLRRAGRWLHAQLKDVDPQFVRDNFCPCTHGAIVLQLVRSTCSTSGETAVDEPRQTIPFAVHYRENVQ